jgi:hypothetical protein
MRNVEVKLIRGPVVKALVRALLIVESEPSRESFGVSVYSATVARIRFDPGSRAYMETRLTCNHCGREHYVRENDIVPECSACRKETDWRPNR